MPRYLKIKDAKYLSGYKILILFSNGEQNIIDFEPFLMKAQNPMTTKYRDLPLFTSFQIIHHDLVWGDYEMCFPLDDLYHRKNLELPINE